jgi:hypothetical protein
MRHKLLSRTSLLASGSILVLATAAVAGSGVGDVFNLGQNNTVDKRTQLRGASDTQQLSVVNTSSALNTIGVQGQSVQGTGVFGVSARHVGVHGTGTAKSGQNFGVAGTSASRDGLAGFFQNTSTTTNPREGVGIRGFAAGAPTDIFPTENYAGGGEFAGPNGVVGYPTVANGAGVAGFTGTQGNYGVYGVATKRDGYAGYFHNQSQNGGPTKNDGIVALAYGATEGDLPLGQLSTGGSFVGPNGVIAVATLSSGAALRAYQGGGSAALLAEGNVFISGFLSKGSGTFRIDHPLDPANKYLSHSFVESPDMMNIYNGNVVTGADGVATVELPGYFEALNREPRYQLTVIGSPATAYVSEEVSRNRFAIRTSQPNVKVSWQVTGIRRDAFAEAHPIVVEQEKALADRGRYLHPVEHGMPASMGIAPAAGARTADLRSADKP